MLPADPGYQKGGRKDGNIEGRTLSGTNNYKISFFWCLLPYLEQGNVIFNSAGGAAYQLTTLTNDTTQMPSTTPAKGAPGPE